MLLRGIPVLTLKRCPVSMSLCILFTISGKRKASEVWSFFLASQDAPSYTLCKLCDVKVKRGKDGDRSSWSATPLWNHLKRHHPEQHRAASEQKDAVEKRRRKSTSRREPRNSQTSSPKRRNTATVTLSRSSLINSWWTGLQMLFFLTAASTMKGNFKLMYFDFQMLYRQLNFSWK